MIQKLRLRNLNSTITHFNVFVKSYSDKTVPLKSIDYCANIVRQHDYENFLATLLMSENIRSPALVLRAFNVEISRIQDQTTDPKTAAFRLQFWQDTINSVYKKDTKLKNIPANPIAQELYKVCNEHKVPKRHIEKLITSRHSLLLTKYFKSLEDLEKYSEDSVSMIYHMLLRIAEVTDIHADHAASHLGKAQGIVNMLRSIHVSNYYKMVTLPMDVLMKYELSQENVLRGIDNENMRNVTYEIASRANSHLKKGHCSEECMGYYNGMSMSLDHIFQEVRQARSITIPKPAKQIFLPAVAIDTYLLKLQKCGFNLFEKSLQRRTPTLPLNLYVKRLFNKF